MASVLNDLRYGLRALTKGPVFSVAAILTLALGIGANAAIFSVVNAVLLRPLPFPDPDRLVRVYSSYPERGNSRGTASPPDLYDWRDQNETFEHVTGFPSLSVGGFVLTGGEAPERIDAHYVEPRFFETLGVPPLIGRRLQEPDYVEGDNAVVVLGHRAWHRRFGGDEGVLGSTIMLSGNAFTVIGVMPPGFTYPSADAEIWVPLSLIPEGGIPRRRGVRFLSALGRMKAGVKLEEAQADLSAIAGRLAREYPESNEQLTEVSLVPLHAQMTGDVRAALLILLAAVGAVLMICCANVANLMLVRAQGRARELAVRGALGASGSRLARQLITEAVLLGVLGGAAGLALGWAGLRGLVSFAPADVPLLDDVRMDPAVLLFAAGASVLTGVLFGLAPACRAWRGDLQTELKVAGGPSAGTEGRNRLRGSLIVAEAALVVVLAIGAGLLLRSLENLMRVDPGFEVDGAISMQVSAPGYMLEGSEDISRFFADVLAAVRRVPGVQAAGLGRPMPLAPDTFQGEDFRFTVLGQPLPPENQEPTAVLRFTSDGFFRAMGIPMIAGRDFEDGDDRDSGRLAGIINRSMARRHWPGEQAVGRRITVGSGELEVIGVVGDVRQTSLDDEIENVVYTSLNQVTRVGMTLVVRTDGDPAALLPGVRAAIWEVNPDQPIDNIATLDRLVNDSVAEQRFSALLVGLFASLALVLAAVGIYGVVSNAVAQRTREIGIRMALGARATDVTRWVIAGGMLWVLGGIGLGLVAALALSRYVASLLFGVGTTDPATYVTAAGTLALVALLASLLPARRAVAVDPVESLRVE